jgi:outer membrane protein
VQEAARDLDAKQRDARSQAARAFDGLEGSRAQLGIRSGQVRVAALALEGVRRDRDAGLRTVIELLNADQELLNAQVQLVSTRADLVVRSYELAASIGRLTALDLALPVVRYDAAANLREARSRFMGIPGTGGDAASTRR